MQFIEILGLILSFLGAYGFVYSLRLFLPRNIVPLVSTSLDETTALLENAEAINTPNVINYWVDLAMYVFVQTASPLLTEPQLLQPTCTDAYGESSLSRVFPATLPAFSVRSDL